LGVCLSIVLADLVGMLWCFYCCGLFLVSFSELDSSAIVVVSFGVSSRLARAFCVWVSIWVSFESGYCGGAMVV